MNVKIEKVTKGPDSFSPPCSNAKKFPRHCCAFHASL